MTIPTHTRGDDLLAKQLKVEGGVATCSCDAHVVLTNDHYSNTVTIVTDTCNLSVFCTAPSKYNCSRALINDYIHNMMSIYIINVITSNDG